MPRAKSRMKRQSKKKPEPNDIQPSRQKTNIRTPSTFKNLLISYLRHLPTLVLGLIFAGATYHILTKVPPSRLEHLILPNTYLPFLLSIFFSVLFIVSFLLLNTRRGFLISLVVIIFLFLRIQQTAISFTTSLIILLPLLLIEISYSLLSRNR